MAAFHKLSKFRNYFSKAILTLSIYLTILRCGRMLPYAEARRISILYILKIDSSSVSRQNIITHCFATKQINSYSCLVF